MYNPGLEVTVDERLAPFRGCCSFKVYIPSKPGKYGRKIGLGLIVLNKRFIKYFTYLDGIL